MQQLDPKSVWLFFIGSILGCLFFIAIFILPGLAGLSFSLHRDGISLSRFFNWLWVIIPIFLVFLWILAKLTYHFYRYELREDGFRKEFGIIWKQYVTIPYDRIQNVDIYRGLVARIFGLSDLHIQTAGMSAETTRGEGRLPGLSREVAEQLRDELVRRAKQLKTMNQGL